MGDALLATAAAVLVSAGVVVIVFAAFGMTEEESDDIALWAVGLLQIPLWAGLWGVPWWVSRRKGRGSLAADFGLRMTWSDIPIGLAAGFVAQVAIGLVLSPLYDLLGVDEDKVGEAARELADRATGPFDVVVLFLVVVVGAAVFEELCYRGLWLRSVERRWGTVAGVVVSSLVFGLVHFQVYDLPALAGFGAVAAVLAVRSGRLGPAIWAHVAFNFTALVALLSA